MSDFSFGTEQSLMEWVKDKVFAEFEEEKGRGFAFMVVALDFELAKIFYEWPLHNLLELKSFGAVTEEECEAFGKLLEDLRFAMLKVYGFTQEEIEEFTEKKIAALKLKHRQELAKALGGPLEEEEYHD